jgi:phosphonate transport system ATP-binding protein
VNFALESAGVMYAKVRALSGLSLQIGAGERVALLGPSGAGKTTVLRLFNATLRASEGRVLVDGRDVSAQPASELRALRRRIGTVFQLPPLVPSLSALQNALCGRLPRWTLWESARQFLAPSKTELARAAQALDAVGLAGREESLASELSGGQQQRVAIARVLLQEPEALLADEPFASLDPGLTASLSRLLFDVAGRGRTLVAALHDVSLALRAFPRIVGISEGRVRFDLPAENVTPRLLEALYEREPRALG